MPMNIEDGVARALKAYKIEKGMTEADAVAWTRAHLAEGILRFKTIFNVRAVRDPDGAAEAAFGDLKAWANS